MTGKQTLEKIRKQANKSTKKDLAKIAKLEAQLEDSRGNASNLQEALLLVLDNVDYDRQPELATQMVGAVLPRVILAKARLAVRKSLKL